VRGLQLISSAWSASRDLTYLSDTKNLILVKFVNKKRFVSAVLQLRQDKATGVNLNCQISITHVPCLMHALVALSTIQQDNVQKAMKALFVRSAPKIT
jgi:hypothetical protein